MSIQVTCGGCFTPHAVPEKYAGRKVRCKECGAAVAVPRPGARPRPRDEDLEFEDEADDRPSPRSRRSAPAWVQPKKKSSARSRRRSPAFDAGFLANKWLIGGGVLLLLLGVAAFVPGIGVLVAFGLIFAGFVAALYGGLRLLANAFQEDVLCGLMYLFVPFYSIYYVLSRWTETWRPLALHVGGAGLMVVSILMIQTAADNARSGGSGVITKETDRTPTAPFRLDEIPISRPQFDEQFRDQSAFLKEPGIKVYSSNWWGRSGNVPGGKTAFRLYLPAGQHRLQSLPCVLVPPAGTNLLIGSRIDPDLEHPEHIPYVQAGYAVVTFSLDGEVPNMQAANDFQIAKAYKEFHAACAGLVNARNAFEFARWLPQVHPDRIFIAGHSSAGTLALLFAAHEPRLAGCIAYAPQTDVEGALGEVAGQVSTWVFPGIRGFVTRSSPKTHLNSIACPVFVFHATDDPVTPFAESREFCNQLQARGKNVTFSQAAGSDHYQTMISPGIPNALDWLRGASGIQPPTSPASSPSSAAPPIMADATNSAADFAQPPPSFAPVPVQPMPDSPVADGSNPAAGEIVTRRFRLLAPPPPGASSAVEQGFTQFEGYIPGSLMIDEAQGVVTIQVRAKSRADTFAIHPLLRARVRVFSER